MVDRRVWVALIFLSALSMAGCRQSPTVGSPTPTDDGKSSPAASPAGASECKEAAGEQIAFELRDFSFNPLCVSGTGQMGLSIKNNGDNLHNFSVEGVPGIDVDIQPGEENNTEATGLPTGTHVVFCKYHRTTNNMQGELRIK